MAILRLMAMKGIITVREFDIVYNKTLRELKGDVIRSMLGKQDRELASLARNLGKF